MVDFRPAAGRFHTSLDWLDSWHSFSFSSHYDPANVGHGLLLVNNDDRVAPASGFGTHAHRDMEIVTWVLSGRLAHRDSEGNEGELYPGLAQRMSAGTGIRHSEMNPSRDEPVHFVQMWVPPDTEGLPPGYQQADVTQLLDGGGLVRVAAGDGHAPIRIHQRAAELWAGRLAPRRQATVPTAPFLHVFVPVGDIELAGHHLGPGDAARLTGEDALDLTAGPGGAEVLVWATGG